MNTCGEERRLDDNRDNRETCPNADDAKFVITKKMDYTAEYCSFSNLRWSRSNASGHKAQANQ